MATTEEVQILVKAVGDATGLAPVTSALRNVQQQGQAAQQQLTSAQQAQQAAIVRGLQESLQKYREGVEQANKLLRETIANVPKPGAEDVRFLSSQIAGATGARPTLTARDLGISADASAVTKAAESTRGLGAATRESETNVLRLAAAFTGFGVGLSLWTKAGDIAHQAMERLIADQFALEQASRQNTVVLGQQAAAFQSWASTISEQSGIMQRSLLEAGTTATQFGREVGFGPEQITGLTAVATALARVRGEDVGQTMSQLTAAMQGNAGAAQALGLQLNASYLAYTRLGGATAEVFNQLSPSTQAWLRYSAAVEQAAAQLQGPVTPTQELSAAMERMGQEMESIAESEAPTLIRALAEMVILVATAADAWANLEKVVASFRPGQLGVDLHNAIANAVAGTPLADLGKAIGDTSQNLGAQTNKLLGIQDSTASTAADTKMEQLKSLISQAAGPISQLQAARQQEIAATKQIVDYRHQIVQTTAQEAEIRLRYLPQQQATAIAQNAAQQQYVAMQQSLLPAQRAMQDLVRATSMDQLNATMQVLPAQREMEDLQRRMTQQQILAQQATLPSSRALEDLQAQIELRRIIAEDPTRSWAERQAAMQEGRTLEYQTSRAQENALRARIAATPVQRAAEDVGLQAQQQQVSIAEVLAPSLRAAEDAQKAAEKLTLEQAEAMKDIARTIEDLALQAQQQALEQAAALLPLEFQQQTLGLLSQIADAARDAAQKTIEIAINGIQVIFQSVTLTPEDEKKIVDLVGTQIAGIIHGAVTQNNTRPASMSLIGARTAGGGAAAGP